MAMALQRYPLKKVIEVATMAYGMEYKGIWNGLWNGIESCYRCCTYRIVYTHGFVEVHLRIDVAIVYWIDRSTRLIQCQNST